MPPADTPEEPTADDDTAASTDAPDAAERPTASGSESGFLSNVEYLTGRDPELGSFLLTIGMVTIVFVALFQLTLPTPVSYLLTAGVLAVTVLSALFAFLLEAFGYFDAPTATIDAAEPVRSDIRPWVPTTRPAKPLPPLVNFDSELRAYATLFDDELPAAFDPFLEDYLRLKTNTENRRTIASDLRADLNPIGTLFDDGSAGDRLYEDISERLFRYIDSQRVHVAVDELTFLDETGNATDVADLTGGVGRVEVVVSNEGEAADVDVVVEFRDDAGAVVASRTCDAGLVSPGARKTLDADVFVPDEAVRATTTLRIDDRGPGVSVGGRRVAEQ